MNVWQNATLSDGNVPKKLVQLFIVANGELKMTGDDARFLVVTSSVASKFQNLSRQILKDCGEVNGGT